MQVIVNHDTYVERLELEDVQSEVVTEPIRRLVLTGHIVGTSSGNRPAYDLRYWESTSDDETLALSRKVPERPKPFRILGGLDYRGTYEGYCGFGPEESRKYFLFLPNDASLIVDTTEWNFNHGPGSPNLTITRKAS
ncbi:hypothetical protein [Siphovirus Jomon_CT89]|nr:hypothetical protein [Siphovirus Jomon_CT89]